MSARIFAIDPGCAHSGVVIYEGGKVLQANAEMPNEEVLEMVGMGAINLDSDVCAIEMIASYGMGVGEEVFRTVWWTGRFAERWLHVRGRLPMEVLRMEVKMEVCNDSRAKDSNIRIALLDRIGPKGTAKNPGPTFGVASHAWQALGVAVTAEKKLNNPSA